MVPVLRPYHNLKHGLQAITSHFRLNRLLEKVSTDYDDQGWWFAFFYFLLFLICILVIWIFVGLCSCHFNTWQPRSVSSQFKSRAFFINTYFVKHLIASRNSTRKIVLRDETGSLIGNSNFFLPLIHLGHYPQRESINAYSNELCFWKGIISVVWLFSCISKLSLLGSRELPACILSNLFCNTLCILQPWHKHANQ